jgi:hypothetical protein
MSPIPITLADSQLMAMPVPQMVELDASALFQLKRRAAERLQVAKAEVDRIDHAIDLKYVERAKQLRLAQGKDSGVVHFDDGEVRVTADLPKKVEWDQAKLGDLVTRITAAGENAAQYVEISYRVSETKFNAWPESLRSQFIPARTLKVGKPAYRLALLSE